MINIPTKISQIKGVFFLFRGVKADVGEMVEHVKLKSWLWIIARSSQFQYPVANRFTNPSGCLGLLKGNLDE